MASQQSAYSVEGVDETVSLYNIYIYLEKFINKKLNWNLVLNSIIINIINNILY